VLRLLIASSFDSASPKPKNNRADPNVDSEEYQIDTPAIIKTGIEIILKVVLNVTSVDQMRRSFNSILATSNFIAS
jgi:hypothetical protein